MRSIVRFSLRFPWLIIAVAAGLLVIGLIQIGNARKDLLPEFIPTTVEVQTEALGLSASEVEQFITTPLEQDLLNGVAFLDKVESASLPGLSSVVMTFESGTDILDARQVVAERLTQAAGLPQVAGPPQMIQPLSSTSRIVIASLSSNELTQVDQSVLARWVIVPRLLSVEGVANVAIWGFRDRQLQVLVDPARLAQEQIGLREIIRTAGNALEVSPLSFLEASSPGTGGFIETVNQRLHVFHQQSISTPDQLAQVTIEDSEGNAIFRSGEPLTLGDVSDIVEDHQPLIGDARCNDGPCLLLVIEKFPEANTPQVSKGIDEAFEALLPGLPGMEIDSSLYQPAEFIDSSFSNLGTILLIGVVLVIIVLGVAFFDWRLALIGAVTIGTSLAGAALVLSLFDATINTMVLAGVVMALVAIVDDVTTGVGLVAQRARQERIAGNGESTARTILHATLEMRRPALYATLIVVATLIPFFVMEGEAGAFFPAIAAAYLIAVVTALVISLTVSPALGVLLFAGNGKNTESPITNRIQTSYKRRAERRVGRTTPAIVTFGVLVLVGLIAIPFLDTDLRPSLQERDIVVRLNGPPGMSLTRMDEVTAAVIEDLRAVPGVSSISAHVGRAIASDQIVNVNSAEVWLVLDESSPYDTTIQTIDDVVAGYTEVSSGVSTYSDQRVTQVLGHEEDQLVVRVYGLNDDFLLAGAVQVQTVVAGVPGTEDVRFETEAVEDTIEVEVDLDRAQILGLKPGDVRRVAATLLSGIVVGNLFEEQKVFDVVVWGSPEIRQTPEDVSNLLIATATGTLVPLSDVADVRVVPNATVIRHESSSKFIDVIATVDQSEMSAVAAEVDSALESIDFPLEHHAEVLGGFTNQDGVGSSVIAVAVAALIGVFLLLQTAFSSWRLATLTLAMLPMAITGSLLATLIFSREVTLGVIAGVIAILALAARWVVSLVMRYQELERNGKPFGPGVVVSGTTDRLVSIVVSGFAIFLLFLPLVVRSGVAGLEIVGPMAIAVVGGVFTTMALALFVLPAVYLKWGYVRQPDD
ncbi:MAG: efflux RND transporter permease subunit, partial [Acidimicrobiia bacterium]